MLAKRNFYFIAGYLFDYLAGSFTRASTSDKFSILRIDEDIAQPDSYSVKKDNNVLKNNNYSFFDTLSKKEGENVELDFKREEYLRSHTAPKSARKVQKTIQKTAKSSLYAMQLGSFKSLNAAETLCDTYIGKGYKAYIVSAEIPGRGTAYRVRIGRFIDINDAQKFSSEFEKKEKVSAFITSK